MLLWKNSIMYFSFSPATYWRDGETERCIGIWFSSVILCIRNSDGYKAENGKRGLQKLEKQINAYYQRETKIKHKYWCIISIPSYYFHRIAWLSKYQFILHRTVFINFIDIRTPYQTSFLNIWQLNVSHKNHCSKYISYLLFWLK